METTRGLTSAQAEELLRKHGPNALEEKPKTPLWRRVLMQISDPMVLVLLAAALISGLLGEGIDSAIILAVVVANTAIGLVQEQKAQQAIDALKKMSAQTARCVREGEVRMMDASLLVPGDLVLLEAGDLVPADMKLEHSASLKIEEASLTGESVPVEKDAKATVPDGVALGDRISEAFYGTSVTYGRGQGIVTATGMRTEMGRIAHMINAETDEQTPLQKKLAEIGKVITFVVIAICVLIFAVGVIHNGGFELKGTLDAFLMSVSLAVAAIPEGMPAVVTIVMAMGVTRMAARKAIIKKLPAVETLGCAQIICSDKTGTLTQNKMNVREVYARGQLIAAGEYMPRDAHDNLLAALELCNDSTLRDDGDIGDPTETALRRFVLDRGMAKEYLGAQRVEEAPFDSERKMMSTVNAMPDGNVVFTKGAPDELLRRCTRIELDDGVVELHEEHRDAIMAANHAMAGKALRVLAAAYKPFAPGEELERDLVFVGLVGMIDPPRPEVYDAVAQCRRAGIIPVMITGDHKDTAIAIAREIGMLEEGTEAIFGNELENMSDEQLGERLERIRVYARVSPEHKVRIVKAWKAKGKVVAMTGDGVNDAPALKTADIGVGMGITGTDVSKGVADMLLADDNFATIVAAVEEGRKIYLNIRKSVQFLLSTNIAEVIALLVATLVLPAGVVLLGPVHILWINLITDSFPAIGLGVDPAEPDLMNEAPRDQNKSFFADGLLWTLLYQGASMAALTLASYAVGNRVSHIAGTTMAFVTLSAVQLFHVFSIKAGWHTVFGKRSFNNRMLLFSVLIPLALLILIVCVPPVSAIFSVAPLTLAQWGIALGLAFVVVPFIEIIKLIKRMFHKTTR